MKFAQVVAAEKSINAILVEALHDRTPHAQLFLGPQGSGTLATALAFAQFLVCEDRSDKDSCGQCPSCQKSQKLVHPDIHFSFPVITKKSGTPPISNDFLVEWRKAIIQNPYLNYFDWMAELGAENKQGNITKQECRSIINKLSLKSFEGGAKILIMWLPEYLGNVGNSLLKIIEEPPKNTFFILVSHNQDLILSTILSRTQLIKFPPNHNKKVQAHLQTHYDVNSEDAEMIAYLAEGDLNKAIKIRHDSALNFVEPFQKWMQLCVQNDISKIMEYSDELCGNGKEYLKNFLINALKILNECIALKHRPNYRPKLLSKHLGFVENFAKFLSFTTQEDLYQNMNRSIRELERNANPKITMFSLSLNLRERFLKQSQLTKKV